MATQQSTINEADWKDERWSPVPIEPWNTMYEVSSHGRVRSLDRIVKTGAAMRKTRRIPGRVLAITLGGAPKHKQQYRLVGFECGDSKVTMRVNRLVALAFLPNPDNKAIVNHRDGNPGNNYVDNLEWATTSENMRHAVDVLKRQLGVPGEGNRAAMLTDVTVRDIRLLHAQGFSARALARLYGVHAQTVTNVVEHICWKHVA